MFTPYSKAWKSKQISSQRLKPGTSNSDESRAGIQHRTSNIQSDPLPSDSGELGHVLKQSQTAAGERAAVGTLRKLVGDPVYEYAMNRDFPAVDGTSQLSPHLRCGTIGIRTILAALAKAREAGTAPAQKQSCDVFLNELIWREFYQQILTNFPHVAKGKFRPEYDALKWSDNRGHFQAWCEGMTGYPIVDAAMRCLNATGWMHNRL